MFLSLNSSAGQHALNTVMCLHNGSSATESGRRKLQTQTNYCTATPVSCHGLQSRAGHLELLELGQGVRLHDQAEAGSEGRSKAACCQIWVSCHGALQAFLVLLVQPVRRAVLSARLWWVNGMSSTALLQD